MSDERDPETDQPLPVDNGNPVIQQLIITEVMQESMNVGFRKYGAQGVKPFNGRDPLKDAEDEARDLLVYLRQARYERDHPPTTNGLVELRDALIALLKTEVPSGGTEDWIYLRNVVEGLLESGPVAKAVQTLRREAFERGASPAVGVLLAEIGEYQSGKFRAGLERAVELLTEAWAEGFHDAFDRGVREGRSQAALEHQTKIKK